ncbi:response regulator [Leekyejoonella antrihumi]|uniref:Response regulator transcription factor n=1 Tax=Leekyejoonella antrihumi TaxID=1660198 RepID=A0A563DUT9_9MICO|nr:response regulator transcription factor [Leekyejoonella antrihumi]TWP34027.1 response regulator transcription factor [Leekyejoonella antrihumi]
MNASPTRVAMIDDQALFRGGLAMVIDSQTDLAFVGDADDGDAAVGLVAKARPDVILMDVRMPRVDGVTATRRICEEYRDTAPKVLVLTTFDLDAAVADAIDAGASGFLLKDAQPEFLLGAIRAVASGSQVVAASATKSLFERFRAHTRAPGEELDRLTDREREIMLRAAQGMSNAEIASAEYLSEATVKTHMSRILSKLQLRDRVQLVVYCYEHGLL